MKIPHRITQKIVFESEHKTLKETVVAAVKSEADLSGAGICDTNFDGARISYRGKTVIVRFEEV